MKRKQESELDEGAPLLVSVILAARALGISRTLLYELMSAGRLRSVKVNRRRFIPRESIDEFIASLTAEGRRR